MTAGLFLSHVAPYIDLSLLMAIITAAAALLSADETRYQGIVFVLFRLYLFMWRVYYRPLMQSVRLAEECNRLDLEASPGNRKDQ
ncbi:MAG: hypothetical protein R2881_04885 [Eubacteriales bacterium]